MTTETLPDTRPAPLDPTTWRDIQRRIRRLIWARRLVDFAFGQGYSVFEDSEIAVLTDYVTLHNDTRPVVDAARAHVIGDADLAALAAVVARYDELYPEHSR